jgi:hypothetical protein
MKDKIKKQILFYKLIQINNITIKKNRNQILRKNKWKG